MSKYILSDIFKGDWPVSQYYGARPEYYKQFGLAGHEGIDFATPTGVEILAPFDGTILRDNDPVAGAYGTHIVVWDAKQKCAVWFCHLRDNNVSLGQVVKKGQVLGHTGNTGNSSGPHLHFNLVATDATGNRLNATNPFKGFMNSLDPKLVEWKLGVQAPLPVPTDPTPQPVPIPPDGAVIIQFGAPTVVLNLSKMLFGVDYNSDEIEAKVKELKEFKPLSSVGEDMMRGDPRFFERWVRPAINAAIANLPPSPPANLSSTQEKILAFFKSLGIG